MNLDNWMVNTVTVKPLLSRDGDGVPTYGTAVKVKCRFERRTRRVLNSEGQEVTTDA